MAQLPLTLYFSPTPTDYVRVIAYPRSNIAVEAANELFSPPHLNPRVVSIYVPSPEIHMVRIYVTPDPEVTGVLRSEYDAKTDYYSSRFIPDLELIVGRGTKQDPSNDEVIIDPVAGTTEVEIPFLDGKEVARIHRSSISRPLAEHEYDLTTSMGEPGIRLLVPGDQFYEDEILRIEFAPYSDSNIGQAIFDLTALLNAHIVDDENPHSVTKAQVGLGLLPNAKSDSYTLNDSNVLATAKAVRDLGLSITNVILYRRSVFIGNIGAVSTGGEITAALNEGGTDTKVVITHNLNISGAYMIWPVLVGRSTGTTGSASNWNIDNDCIVTVGNSIGPNNFDLMFRKLGNVITNITCHYLIIRT